MFRQNPDQPALLIVAGPNGSGKSTAYDRGDYELGGRSIWIVNPDLLSKRIAEQEGLEKDAANLEAVKRIEAWLDASIEVHKTVGVETVLSTDKYRRIVTKARSRGYLIWFLYVLLDSPDRNVERVALRAKKGGHDVPEQKIRERYGRSLVQFPWFLDQADQAWVYDNSGAEIRLIAAKAEGVITIDAKALPAIRDAIDTLRTS